MHSLPEQWEGASSSKYSFPGARSSWSHQYAAANDARPYTSQSQSQSNAAAAGARQLELRPAPRLGPMDTVDDFITNESGNSLLLCVFSILLVFPGSACLLVIGAAFTLDQSLQERHQWVRPCAIVMLVLGAVLLVTASVIFASICRSYRRARARRLVTVAAGNGSPYTCIVQV